MNIKKLIILILTIIITVSIYFYVDNIDFYLSNPKLLISKIRATLNLQAATRLIDVVIGTIIKFDIYKWLSETAQQLELAFTWSMVIFFEWFIWLIENLWEVIIIGGMLGVQFMIVGWFCLQLYHLVPNSHIIIITSAIIYISKRVYEIYGTAIAMYCLSLFMYGDCWDNRYGNPIRRYFTLYYHEHGGCEYTWAGFLKHNYWILIAIYILIYIICFERTINTSRFYANGTNLPSMWAYTRYWYHYKRPTFWQFWTLFKLGHLYIYYSNEEYAVELAGLIKSFKTERTQHDIIRKLRQQLPSQIHDDQTGHNYEATCRKMIRKLIKQNLPIETVHDYGTKQDVQGSSLYKHHGDMRYRVAVNVPHGKDVIMIDVSHHMSEHQYAYINIHNNSTTEYIPIPLTKWLQKAQANSDHIIYSEQVGNGDVFIDEKLYYERLLTNSIYTGVFDVTYTSTFLNISDHHLVKHNVVTGILPNGFFPKPVIDQTNFVAITTEETTLVVLNDKWHKLETSDFDKMKQATNYDRCSTINNRTCINEDKGFQSIKFANGQEYSTMVKDALGKPLVFDIRYGQTKCMPKLIDKPPAINDMFFTDFKQTKKYKIVKYISKKQEEKQEMKTEVKMEEPKPIKMPVHVTDKPINLSPYLPQTDIFPLKATRTGPITASEPLGHPLSSIGSWATRFLTKAAPKKMDLSVFDYAKEFAQLIAEEIGEVLPNAELLRQDQTEIKHSTMFNTEKASADKNVAEAQIKRECYPWKNNYARNVLNDSKRSVIDMAPYSKALHEAMAKKCHWYLPGKLETVAAKFLNAVGMDFAKFEASQGVQVRYVIMELGKLVFPGKHAKGFLMEFKNMVDYDIKFDITTKLDKKIKAKRTSAYVDGNSKTKSGDSFTTPGNTMIGGFVTYMAYRRLGNEPKVAYAMLKYGYGDDVIVEDGKLKDIAKVAEKCGMEITEERYKGANAYSLLGKVCNSDGKKTFDAVRMLSKFNVSYGNHADVVNTLNKWAGAYNPKLEIKEFFGYVGKIAYDYVTAMGKYQKDEYTVLPTSGEVNDTYEAAFRGQHKNLFLELRSIEVDRLTAVEFINIIANMIKPYVDEYFDLGDKTGYTMRDGVLLYKNSEFKVDLDVVLRNYEFQHEAADYINKEFKEITGCNLLRDAKPAAYIKQVISVLKLANIKYTFAENGKVPGLCQNQTLKLNKHKQTKNTNNVSKQNYKQQKFKQKDQQNFKRNKGTSKANNQQRYEKQEDKTD